MSGVSIRIQINDAKVRAALDRIEALTRDMSPVMQGIATLLQHSTRERFRSETAPSGEQWQPSLRKKLKGGFTLTQSGHLSDSISSASGRDFAQVGTNRIYAGIHQFGGVIKPKAAGGSLRFRLASGQFVVVKQVTMPARSFLGISDHDEQDIKALVIDHFDKRLRP